MKKKLEHEKTWWTLQFEDGNIDLDCEYNLHLYPTKNMAIEHSYDYQNEPNDPLPKPVKIEIVIKDK